MPVHSVDLSVVIPAWNEAESLPETIDRIKNALSVQGADGLTWEIIVCDNASTDDTSEIARRAGTLVVFEPKRGIARARNAGADVARGEWLLFIDADTYPPRELLAEVRVLLGEGGTVGCGSTMKAVDGKWWVRGLIWRNSLLLQLWGLASGAFLLCRHEAFRAIGGFRADLYALEDIDLVARLRVYGRARGQRFRMLHRHPVITSGRTKGSFATMILSYLIALVLLPLQSLLPRRLRIRGSTKLLSFWYPRDR